MTKLIQKASCFYQGHFIIAAVVSAFTTVQAPCPEHGPQALMPCIPKPSPMPCGSLFSQ